MSQDRRLLIITGTILIALIIAIAAFSLGVYIGVHGWTAGPPAVVGPGQKLPRPPAQEGQAPGGAVQPPPTSAPGQPLPRPQLLGRVRSVSGDMITLDTAEGLRLFQVAEDVKVLRKNRGEPGEGPALLEEVEPGEHLAVYGYFEGNVRWRLIARRVVLLPPPPEQQP
jgi:hypothetical protein